MSQAREALRAIAGLFKTDGQLVEVVALPGGHIHDSYLATYLHAGRAKRYVHQHINHAVFSDPLRLMGNIQRVTEHLRSRSERNDFSQHPPVLVPSTSGKPYCVDDSGAYWRTYRYIEGAHTYAAVPSPQVAERAARAFGVFVRMLTDLPAPPLHVVLSDFHHTPKRLARLREAAEADAHGRVVRARAEIDFAYARATMAPVLTELLTRGELFERTVHNDTKINNLLFDASDNVLCVIDLDTVMPGLVLHDFGDLVRSSLSAAAEDQRDLAKIGVRLDVFAALVRGYREGAGPLLTKLELELFPFAGKLITFETGIRFLTDYLEGDGYFRIRYPLHNLERARNQFALVRSIERHEAEMSAAVASVCRG